MHKLIRRILRRKPWIPSTPNVEVTVPDGQRAWVVRDGGPDGGLPAGHHLLDPGRGRMQVRMEPTRPPSLDVARTPPDPRALLFLDGRLVAIVQGASQGGGTKAISAWTAPGSVRSGRRDARPRGLPLEEWAPALGACA